MKCFAILLLAILFATPAFADGRDDDDKPKAKPPALVVPAQEPERHKENFWGGAAFGGLALTAFQKTEHPTLYAIGAGIATAAAIETAQPGAFQGKNFRYAVAGVALGASGTGLVFGQRFFGWQTSIKW